MGIRLLAAAALSAVVSLAVAQGPAGPSGGPMGPGGESLGAGSGAGSGSHPPPPPGPPGRGSGECSGSTCDFRPDERMPKSMSGRVEGQSGKITFFRSNGDLAAPDRVRFEFDSATERAANGDAAGHTANTFANRFVVSGFQPSFIIGNTNGTRIEMNATFPFGVIGAEVIFVERDGEVENEGEVIKVHGGGVKVNLFIRSWTFCNAAGSPDSVCSARGEFVDVAFLLMSPPRHPGAPDQEADEGERGPPPEGRPRPSRPPRQVDLDGGARMVLSTLVQTDGEWRNITSDFPKVERAGVHTKFTVRFPRFTGSAFYDPSLVYSEDPSSGAASSLRAAHWATTALVVLIVALVQATWSAGGSALA